MLYYIRWNSLVGIVTGYVLDGRVSITSRIRVFSLLHNIQPGPGAHPASNPLGTWELFPGLTRPGPEADHLSPSSAKINNDGAIPPLPDTYSWHGA
jgi:hypothetical protein